MVQCSIFTHMGGASGVAGGAAVILGRNDPLRGAERFITWGESTHAGRIDPGRIDHGADRPAPIQQFHILKMPQFRNGSPLHVYLLAILCSIIFADTLCKIFR